MSDDTTNTTAASAVGYRLDRGVRATTREPGLLEMLKRAAQIIESDAASMRACHTVGGRWPEDEEDARLIYEENRAVAKRLRNAAKYMAPNPLGGPAKVFDACADAIRAGDSIDAAMANYGLAWRPNVGVEGPRAATEEQR